MKERYHHHWCYAAYKKESGLYDFTRYYLGLDRKFHSFIKTHVDMMIKGGVEIHNQHEWVSLFFFLFLIIIYFKFIFYLFYYYCNYHLLYDIYYQFVL